jgi:hypothetical protein
MVIPSDDPAAMPGPLVTKDPVVAAAPDPYAGQEISGQGGMMFATPTRPLGADGKQVEREQPTPNQQRSQLVNQLIEDVKRAKKHWDIPFKTMQRDMQFAGGDQWKVDNPLITPLDVNPDIKDPRYVANITLRHVQQKVSALYARNPMVTV